MKDIIIDKLSKMEDLEQRKILKRYNFWCFKLDRLSRKL